MIKEEGGAVSGLALRFVNQVAERLGRFASRQDWSTCWRIRTPRTLRRWCGRWPTCRYACARLTRARPIRIEPALYNRRFRERLEQWSRIAPKLLIWQYSVNFSHYLAPFPNYDELISDIPMFQRAGVSGLFIEGAVSEGGGGDDAELRSYLAARLLWKPDIDAEAEIRGFLDAVYGPAAPQMWKYFVLRQHEIRRGQHLWIDQNLDAPYLTRDFLKHGRALLERASAKGLDERGAAAH